MITVWFQGCHSFIFSHLDFCNSLFTVINQNNFYLYLVQNVASRLFPRKGQSHITMILASLNWLLITFTIHGMIILIAEKALHSHFIHFQISSLLAHRFHGLHCGCECSELWLEGQECLLCRKPSSWISWCDINMMTCNLSTFYEQTCWTGQGLTFFSHMIYGCTVHVLAKTL